MISETSCEWLMRVTRERIDDVAVPINTYIQNRSLGFNRPGVLVEISEKSKLAGLSAFFIEKDIFVLKENFYVVGKLLQKSHYEGWDAFANYAPLLYGLLSDSPEIYSWLARAELKNKDDLGSPHFLFHQFQLVLQNDDSALRKTIAKLARSGSKQGGTYAQVGADFFPLLLKRDENGLQALIEKLAVIKSAQEPEGKFIAGFAAIHAKLCWYRGLEVEVLNSLVPMPLMPIKPLDAYEIEYDFLQEDWTPPAPPGFFAKAKRLFSGR